MAEAVRVAHRAAVNAGVDSIGHGSFLDEATAAVMARKGTWLIPTVYVGEEMLESGPGHGMSPAMMDKARAVMKVRRVGFETAVHGGVRMVFGVDAQPEVAPKEFDALFGGPSRLPSELRAHLSNTQTLSKRPVWLGTKAQSALLLSGLRKQNRRCPGLAW